MEDGGLPAGWTLDRVQTVGQLRDPPRLLDLSTPVTVDTTSGPEKVRPLVVLDVGGYVLVLDSSDEEWLMGTQDAHGAVRCWASWGPDLARALRGLSEPTCRSVRICGGHAGPPWDLIGDPAHLFIMRY